MRAPEQCIVHTRGGLVVAQNTQAWQHNVTIVLGLFRIVTANQLPSMLFHEYILEPICKCIIRLDALEGDEAVGRVDGGEEGNLTRLGGQTTRPAR